MISGCADEVVELTLYEKLVKQIEPEVAKNAGEIQVIG